MRILLITHYFEPDSGAAAVRLSRLARLLAARGHQVTVLTTLPHYPTGIIRDGYRRRFTLTEQRDGVTVIRAWLWATPSTRISRRLLSQLTFMVSAFMRGLALQRPDVVLIEAQPVFTGFAGVLLSRLKRAPYVLNVSDLWPDHLLSVGALTERHPVYRLLRALVNRMYRGAAHIVAMSPVWADKIRAYIGQAAPVLVQVNGVDLLRFRPVDNRAPARERLNLPADQFTVSFIGAFTTQNDFATLLTAFAHLSQQEAVLCMLAGGGTQADEVAALLAQPGLQAVRWLGWLPHDRIPDVWAASDVTVLALRSEMLYRGTIPAKFFEALAAGVPVVAAVEGAAADLLKASGGGLVTPLGNAPALAQAVMTLLEDNTLRAQCAAAARAYAEQHFDPERVASAYETVLSSAIVAHAGTDR